MTSQSTVTVVSQSSDSKEAISRTTVVRIHRVIKFLTLCFGIADPANEQDAKWLSKMLSFAIPEFPRTQAFSPMDAMARGRKIQLARDEIKAVNKAFSELFKIEGLDRIDDAMSRVKMAAARSGYYLRSHTDSKKPVKVYLFPAVTAGPDAKTAPVKLLAEDPQLLDTLGRIGTSIYDGSIDAVWSRDFTLKLVGSSDGKESEHAAERLLERDLGEDSPLKKITGVWKFKKGESEGYLEGRSDIYAVLEPFTKYGGRMHIKDRKGNGILIAGVSRDGKTTRTSGIWTIAQMITPLDAEARSLSVQKTKGGLFLVSENGEVFPLPARIALDRHRRSEWTALYFQYDDVKFVADASTSLDAYVRWKSGLGPPSGEEPVRIVAPFDQTDAAKLKRVADEKIPEISDEQMAARYSIDLDDIRAIYPTRADLTPILEHIYSVFSEFMGWEGDSGKALVRGILRMMFVKAIVFNKARGLVKLTDTNETKKNEWNWEYQLARLFISRQWMHKRASVRVDIDVSDVSVEAPRHSAAKHDVPPGFGLDSKGGIAGFVRNKTKAAHVPFLLPKHQFIAAGKTESDGKEHALVTRIRMLIGAHPYGKGRNFPEQRGSLQPEVQGIAETGFLFVDEKPDEEPLRIHELCVYGTVLSWQCIASKLTAELASEPDTKDTFVRTGFGCFVAAKTRTGEIIVFFSPSYRESTVTSTARYVRGEHPRTATPMKVKGFWNFAGKLGPGVWLQMLRLARKRRPREGT